MKIEDGDHRQDEVDHNACQKWYIMTYCIYLPI